MMMDVSFILSQNELYTLLSAEPKRTEAGAVFLETALSGAERCDLSGLVERKLARRVSSGPEPAPVIAMLSCAISQADSAEESGGIWEISSQWLSIRCEAYPYQEEHLKITLLEGSL